MPVVTRIGTELPTDHVPRRPGLNQNHTKDQSCNKDDKVETPAEEPTFNRSRTLWGKVRRLSLHELQIPEDDLTASDAMYTHTQTSRATPFSSTVNFDPKLSVSGPRKGFSYSDDGSALDLMDS